MASRWITPADRLRSGGIATAFMALAGWLFLNGLYSAHRANEQKSAGALPVLFTIPPEPKPIPPPKPPPAPAKTTRRPSPPDPKGAASAPNLRSRATAIQAPPIDRPKPAPIVAAPVALNGSDATSGASDRSGPGTGAGGSGNGIGSGDSGAGSGGGGGGGTPPVQIAGRIRDSDYPRQAGTLGIGGAVEVRYAIDPDGRARDCVILASSGNPMLDATTCRLIERRFRFRPSHGPDGRPRRVYMEQRHEWIVQNLPPEQDGGD